MNYHIVLTRQCNLNCAYCHGGEQAENTEITYSLDELDSFLKHDADPQLMFYGGEPTLRIGTMTDMMERFSEARFMLQTNALLLQNIPIEYVKRIHSILISIDGRKHVTDGYRSKGVYDKVLENIRWLRGINYPGDVVARMAVSQQSDIYKDVKHLLDLEDPSFDHVHWQLNVIWDAEGNWQDFDKWVAESYNPGITCLVEEWVEAMKFGQVRGIVPFLPIMYTLLAGEFSRLRCGSGSDTFAIHVDGRIGICPISPDWEFSIVGDICRTEPEELRNIMTVDEPCPSCEVYHVCGGRCLFANKQRLWGQEGFNKICATVRHLIRELERYVPDVKRLVEQGIIDVCDFNYPQYNNGCEIIP